MPDAPQQLERCEPYTNQQGNGLDIFRLNHCTVGLDQKGRLLLHNEACSACGRFVVAWATNQIFQPLSNVSLRRANVTCH